MTEERNGRVKWVIGIISTVLLTGAGFLAGETYRGRDRLLQAHETRIDALETQDAAQREAQRRIEAMLGRIEAKVDRLQEKRR